MEHGIYHMDEDMLQQLHRLEIDAIQSLSCQFQSQQKVVEDRHGLEEAPRDAVYEMSADPFFDKILPEIRPGVVRSSRDILSMAVPQFSCSITLRTSSAGKWDLHRSPVGLEDDASCDFFDSFGSHRFLVATLRHMCADNALEVVRRQSLQELYKAGLTLAGRHYSILGGEQLGVGSTRREHSFVEEAAGSEGLDGDDTVDSTKLRLWLFAEHDDSGHLPRISADYLIHWLGEFPRDSLPARINARLKLGFSKTLPACSLTDDQVHMTEDIYSADGHIMTDGCGFISPSLARNIPYDVLNGQPRETRHDGMSLPSVVQVRLRCHKGLFKGCLIVVSDTKICPADGIVLRPSMRKAGASLFIKDRTHSSLRVNSTFEHSSYLDRAGSLHDASIQLNRSLCILLCHLGVPFEVFERLMHNEMHELLNATLSRQQAYSLTQRFIRSWGGGRRSVGGKGAAQGVSIGTKALRFLMAGHSLQEPMLCDYLLKIQLQGVSRLEKCRMRLSDSICLVGVPDPIGLLEENEIFVVLPKDRLNVQSIICTYDNFSVSGKVAVTRSPTFFPGDIRLLQAVHHPALFELLKDTSGGVIVFSTHGRQTPVAYMSGGDFDGDKYYAIFNSEVVGWIKEVDPFVDNEISDLEKVTSTSDSELSCTDLRWKILSGLTHDASQSLVGRYGNALKAWLDPSVPGGGPSSENLRRCYSIYLTSLDSAKTGRSPLQRRGLLDVRRPHYLTTKNAIVSSSVAGKLFDIVRDAKVDLQTWRAPIELDAEMTYRDINSLQSLEEAKQSLLKEVYNRICQGRGKAYGELWAEHHREYKSSARAILDENKDPTDIGISFDALKQKYVALFNESVEALMSETCPVMSDTCARSLCSLDSALIYSALREKTRRQLATVVYLATYRAASAVSGSDMSSTVSGGGQKAVSFCWEICPEELHRNKGDNVASRSVEVAGRQRTGPTIETLISTELQYSIF